MLLNHLILCVWCGFEPNTGHVGQVVRVELQGENDGPHIKD